MKAVSLYGFIYRRDTLSGLLACMQEHAVTAGDSLQPRLRAVDPVDSTGHVTMKPYRFLR